MIQVKLIPRQQLPRVDIPDGPVADLRNRLPQPAGIVQLPGAGLMHTYPSSHELKDG